MVPIYDTDIAQQRWDKSDWQHYELWERVEQRLRRHRRIWIASTAAVFLVLSSVPIILDRAPKWTTLSASRRLAEEINAIRREAGVSHAAFRIRFDEGGALTYRLERSSSCSDPSSQLVRTGAIVDPSKLGEYRLLTRSEGAALGVPGLLRDVCYDYLAGADTVLRGEGIAGFGIIPVKDLAEGRSDRMSILIVSGPAAEISFD